MSLAASLESRGPSRAGKVLLLFIDGIGIGIDDAEINPFARVRSAYLPLYAPVAGSTLPDKGILVATKSDMGIAGLPQSATGQTALFCGVPSAAIVGRHISGFPTPSLRKLIDAHSIFLSLKALGKKATFANALSDAYFLRYGERISATTRAQRAAGFPPRMISDLCDRRAVSHDLTNHFLAGMGYDVPLFEVEETAEILATLIEENDFCLFEYILTDRAGHARDMDAATSLVQQLDRFLDALLAHVDLAATTVVLTSDHGNMEDLGVKTHTRNPVPTCLWGAGRSALAERVTRIEEMTPAILSLYN